MKLTREFGQVLDLTGQIFGELTVISLAGFDRNRHALWVCDCSCGVQKVIRGTNLRARKNPTVSCTHFQKELAAELCSVLTKGKFGEAHPMFGKNASTETRAKMSAAHMKDFDIAQAQRLRAIGWSDRKIAKHLNMGRTAVGRKLGMRVAGTVDGLLLKR
jgi:hypothetical protein